MNRLGLDIYITALAVIIVLMMVIPLPQVLLDILIALNFTITLMILLTTFYVKRPVDFHVFPSLLILTTLFRIGINVSTTRAILTYGPAMDIKIIRAFGEFVVRGNYVVGIIIFIILLAVQYLVIARGSVRIAEVAARFTLDALPAKQLSIQEDLANGIITPEEARRRKEELEREASFYGAMDGASRFIQGDAILSIVITLVDIIGGLIVGILMRGEGLAEAAQTYVLFTVGDGLTSQIPALLVSTSAGIIISRSATAGEFASDILKQITYQPRALLITAGFLAALSILPGFPTIPLLLLSAGSAYLGYSLYRAMEEEKRKEELARKEKEETEKVETYEDIVSVEPLEIEIGQYIIPLVDKEQGGDLLDRIRMIRKRIAQEIGLLVPPIRIRDNISLDPYEYVIKIKGTEVARYKVYPNKFLVIVKEGEQEKIGGIPAREPVFGLPAVWITENMKKELETKGYDVYDASAVLATHLTEIIKDNAHELLGRQEVRQILDVLRNTHPAVVDDATRAVDNNIGIIQKVLQNLLKENISIRNMVTILEAIADFARTSNQNPDILTEYVRQALARQIAKTVADQNNVIKVLVIDPELEQQLIESVKETSEGFIYTIEPDVLNKLLISIEQETRKVVEKGWKPVIICASKIRKVLEELSERIYKKLVVLSYSEIPPGFSIETVGVISIKQLQGIST